MIEFGKICVAEVDVPTQIIFHGRRLQSDSQRSCLMGERRYRVLLVLTHPVQYMSPVLREMSNHPKLDITAAYCSLQGAKPELDPDFGMEIAWDIPLLDGYPWSHVPNRSFRPGLGRFFGLVNPALWKIVRTGGFDIVVILTGYRYATFWIAAMAARAKGLPILFGTDAHDIASRDGSSWKKRIKKWFWPRLYGLADVVIVPSSGGVNLMQSLGIPPERIVLTPYTVDNKWWIEQSTLVNRSAVRAEWGIPDDARVVLFCAKLQPWKRPHDLLRAFAKANVERSYLIFAGDGPLRTALEVEAQALGLADRLRFLGFVNQTKLPLVYRASDLLVLPSEYEPFGVVVNEAMLSGCPVIVSDMVGARFDLVRNRETGFVFPVGNIEALAALLGEILPARESLQQMGSLARQRMADWSPEKNIEGLIRAIEVALWIGPPHKKVTTR
jgi:glycosyltransferase involved in cell wall biosynthesis